METHENIYSIWHYSARLIRAEEPWKLAAMHENIHYFSGQLPCIFTNVLKNICVHHDIGQCQNAYLIQKLVNVQGSRPEQ